MSALRLEFTTPLFSRGAYEDRPEVRPASIRGQLHWWFRALGGGAQDEKMIFGGVHGGAVASRVVVRVQHAPLHGEWIPTLPHKPPGRTAQHGPNAPRIGVRAGLAVDLHILTRLGGLDGRLQPVFDRTLEAWLLL
ncbi:MAG: type III-B CRISPR module RAMP protein Cmr1, partial [Limisphaerales bacterium]